MGLRKAFKHFVAKNRRSAPVKSFALFCKNVYKEGYENWNYDFNKNGEFRVLKKLQAFDIKTILDVGANVGDWSSFALDLYIDAKIHAFEIVPQTFEILKSNISEKQDRITLNNLGLSDSKQTIDIKYAPQSNGQSSMFTFLDENQYEIVACQVIAGDTYIEENNIEQVNLLKIDTEGAEHLVLKGFEKTLSAQKIDVIQFEYGRVNILSKFLLYDFYNFFEEQGYKVGKIYPNYVDFKAYDFEDENFIGPNYVAIKASRTDIIEALK